MRRFSALRRTSWRTTAANTEEISDNGLETMIMEPQEDESAHERRVMHDRNELRFRRTADLFDTCST